MKNLQHFIPLIIAQSVGDAKLLPYENMKRKSAIKRFSRYKEKIAYYLIMDSQAMIQIILF